MTMRATLLLALLAAAATPATAQGNGVMISTSEFIAGKTVQVSITFEDSRPQSTTLFVRPLGEAAYQELPGVDQGDGEWLVELPFAYPPQGVEGYAEYVLDGETLTEPAEDPAQNPIRVPAFNSTITSAVSLPARLHRMVTVPLVLGPLDGAPQEPGSDDPVDVIGRTFGSSGDPALWRAFRWDAGEQRYLDAVRDPGFDRVGAGLGFWLVTSGDGPFSVDEGYSAGVAFDGDVTRAEPVAVRLQTGWNQIGNPYLFPVQWSDVERPAGVEDPVAHEPGADNGTYIGGQTTLGTWEGYFVFNDGPPADVRFRVRPGAADRTSSQPLAQRIRERAGPGSSVLAVTARSGARRDAVYLGRDGVATGAPIDLRKPPALGPGFRLSVVSDGQDWIGRFDGGGVWTLALEGEGDVTLDLEAFGEWPGVVVEDVDRGRALAVVGGRVRVPAGGASSRTLRVRIGGEAGRAALGPSLGTPRPNPSTDRVSVPFALPAAGPVEVEVVDVLGRTVRRVLRSELEAGSHAAEWDGADASGGPVAAGVYLVRLHSESGTATTRITRLR